MGFLARTPSPPLHHTLDTPLQLQQPLLQLCPQLGRQYLYQIHVPFLHRRPPLGQLFSFSLRLFQVLSCHRRRLSQRPHNPPNPISISISCHCLGRLVLCIHRQRHLIQPIIRHPHHLQHPIHLLIIPILHPTRVYGCGRYQRVHLQLSQQMRPGRQRSPMRLLDEHGRRGSPATCNIGCHRVVQHLVGVGETRMDVLQIRQRRVTVGRRLELRQIPQIRDPELGPRVAHHHNVALRMDKLGRQPRTLFHRLQQRRTRCLWPTLLQRLVLGKQPARAFLQILVRLQNLWVVPDHVVGARRRHPSRRVVAGNGRDRRDDRRDRRDRGRARSRRVASCHHWTGERVGKGADVHSTHYSDHLQHGLHVCLLRLQRGRDRGRARPRREKLEVDLGHLAVGRPVGLHVDQRVAHLVAQRGVGQVLRQRIQLGQQCPQRRVQGLPQALELSIRAVALVHLVQGRRNIPQRVTQVPALDRPVALLLQHLVLGLVHIVGQRLDLRVHHLHLRRPRRDTRSEDLLRAGRGQRNPVQRHDHSVLKARVQLEVAQVELVQPVVRVFEREDL